MNCHFESAAVFRDGLHPQAYLKAVHPVIAGEFQKRLLEITPVRAMVLLMFWGVSDAIIRPL